MLSADRGETCLIDTVDSGAHYRVKGSIDDVCYKLGAQMGYTFVQFELTNGRSIRIAPYKVIAVLEPPIPFSTRSTA